MHGKNKWKCNICKPLYSFQDKIRHKINNAMIYNSETPTIELQELLGCDIIEYKAHIASQFKYGMSWDNHKELWEIDHIVPIMYNNPTKEEVLERFHHTNVQPIFKEDNQQKGHRHIG